MDEKPIRSDLERAEQEFAEKIGDGHLIGFRNDLERVWVKNREGESFDIDSNQVAREVNYSLQRPRRALRTFEDLFTKVTILDGLAGGGLAIIIHRGLITFGVSPLPAAIPSILVFLFFTVINHGILYTGAFFNHMCYSEASPREEDSRLLFKRAWNAKVLMSSRSVLGIFIAAFMRRRWPDAYQLGLKYIGDRE